MKPAITSSLGFAFALCAASSLAQPPTPTWREPVTGMPFVRIEKGCYRMGANVPVPPPANTEWEAVGYQRTLSENEMPQHEVCVDGFWIGQYEVTWQEYATLTHSTAGAPERARFPLAGVTWHDAVRFAQRLGELSGGKHQFRLPTEAEWELVCRAGADGARAENPEALARSARYGLGTPEWDRFGPNVGEVGQKEPNAFGVYDMLGNVWEWTSDAYASDAYTRHALYNPSVSGASSAPGAPRVIRGASFRTEFQQVRCTKRGRQAPSEALDSIGFRLVRTR